MGMRDHCRYASQCYYIYMKVGKNASNIIIIIIIYLYIIWYVYIILLAFFPTFTHLDIKGFLNFIYF